MFPLYVDELVTRLARQAAQQAQRFSLPASQWQRLQVRHTSTHGFLKDVVLGIELRSAHVQGLLTEP